MQDDPQHDERARILVRLSTVIYGIMAITGAAVAHYGRAHLWPLLAMPHDAQAWRTLLILPFCATGMLLIANVFLLEYSVSYRRLRRFLAHIAGRLSVPAVLYLAVLSAVGEELAFRAAMQPYLGIFWTSLLFGVLHQGPGGPLSAWSLWAFFAGLLLGWMTQGTGSLWPALLCHAAVNAYSLISLRSAFLRGMADEGDDDDDDEAPPALLK